MPVTYRRRDNLLVRAIIKGVLVNFSMKKKNENIKIEKLSTSAFQNHQKKDLKVAEKLYKKILKLNPNHFESNFYLGILSAQDRKSVV